MQKAGLPQLPGPGAHRPALHSRHLLLRLVSLFARGSLRRQGERHSTGHGCRLPRWGRAATRLVPRASSNSQPEQSVRGHSRQAPEPPRSAPADGARSHCGFASVPWGFPAGGSWALSCRGPLRCVLQLSPCPAPGLCECFVGCGGSWSSAEGQEQQAPGPGLQE